MRQVLGQPYPAWHPSLHPGPRLLPSQNSSSYEGAHETIPLWATAHVQHIALAWIVTFFKNVEFVANTEITKYLKNVNFWFLWPH